MRESRTRFGPGSDLATIDSRRTKYAPTTATHGMPDGRVHRLMPPCVRSARPLQRESTAMPDDSRETLQRFIDGLFENAKRVSRLDIILRAEVIDLDADLMPIIANLPGGGTYTRQLLTDQINSAIVGHGWSRRYGTVE